MTSLSSIAPIHLISLLLIKIAALSVALTVSEQKGRDLIPLIGVLYVVTLPFMIWLWSS
ncbi:MAG: hypothetical protein AAGC81_02090 [Pseudomonadota bacterium]